MGHERTYGLGDFVQEARNAIAQRLPAAETLGILSAPFKRLLDNRSFVREMVGEESTIGDEICLYRDPELDFVVLVRGVSPRPDRQGSSHAVLPHDHGPLWALYGIYEGRSRLRRYEPDAGAQSSDFPGLRMTSDVPAEAGDFDAIEPHNMHLPITDPETGSVILVVYNQPLESVVRRAYAPSRKGLIQFQGIFPPSDQVATKVG